MTDDSDLAAVAAKQAITETLYRYCRGIDRMDAPLTLSCWHHDGTADYGGLYRGTAVGFVEWLWPVHARMVGHRHELANVLIELAGDAAASEAYVVVTLRVAEADGQVVDILGQGRYLDRWERRNGRWAIAHRIYVNDLRTTRTVEQRDMSAHLPSGPQPVDRRPSRRDRNDVSYQIIDRDSAPPPVTQQT